MVQKVFYLFLCLVWYYEIEPVFLRMNMVGSSYLYAVSPFQDSLDWRQLAVNAGILGMISCMCIDIVCKIQGCGTFWQGHRLCTFRCIDYNIFIEERSLDSRHQGFRVFGKFIEHFGKTTEPLLLVLYDASVIRLFPHIEWADMELLNPTVRVVKTEMHWTVSIGLRLGHIVHETASLLPVCRWEEVIYLDDHVLFLGLFIRNNPQFVRFKSSPDIMFERYMIEIAAEFLHLTPYTVWFAISYIPADDIAELDSNRFPGCFHERLHAFPSALLVFFKSLGDELIFLRIEEAESQVFKFWLNLV